MNDTMPLRQIHLDFHTSEHISRVGSDFAVEDFISTLRLGNVNSVTLFARGHHGWCYYPTKVGAPHPHLEHPDLLGDMLKGCRKAGIASPAYLTVQWDEYMARKHPEWRVMSAWNASPHYKGTEPSAMYQLTPSWHTLCLSHSAYVDYLISLGKELISLYDVTGFFMDIVSSHECVCTRCLELMKERGLDPLSQADRKQNDEAVNEDFRSRFSRAMREENPSIRVFYNGGHIHKGKRSILGNYSHLELESLPTGGWGYDHFPISARYADTLGMEFLGMTGKFHTHWGEFGGYKRPEALEYECCQMVSLGAACSIGDQLHPSGRLDEATYRIIAPAYKRIQTLEPYLKNSRYMAEVAILSSEANQFNAAEGFSDVNRADTGAARMLLELHVPFDVLDGEADFSSYRVLVLPDNITMNQSLQEKISSFTNAGGKLIFSGTSCMDEKAEAFMLDTGMIYHGKQGEWDPDYVLMEEGLDDDLILSPLIHYGRARIVSAGKGKVWGTCRRPYFNRSWDHFCSHLHAPVVPDAPSHGDAVVETPLGFYFAHEIFSQYYDIGQPQLKYMFRGALTRLVEKPLLKTSLLSAGRASVLFQEEKKRYTVNLLYAPTQLRGSRYKTLQGAEAKIEIMEDVPVLHGVWGALRLSFAPARVYDAYSGADLEWNYDGEYVHWEFPRLHIHGAAIVEL